MAWFAQWLSGWLYAPRASGSIPAPNFVNTGEDLESVKVKKKPNIEQI